jgi:nitrite reductase/ring-hydroxylating ferredoxin subunit
MGKHRVCHVGDVYEGEMKAFNVEGRRVLVANVGGDWYAVEDTCTHADASLALGTLDVEECTVSCPLHGGVFELATGEGVEYPVVDPVETYAVTIEEEEVYVTHGP